MHLGSILAPLVRSWIALGAILASGFGYNVFFLHETQHGFHIRFSFSPCSAAVRAQHMELKRQGSFFMENPIFDELSFQFFEEKKSVNIASFRKSKNPQI